MAAPAEPQGPGLVSQLLDETPILGRDFMQTYDVALDIPARTLCIRNSARRYSVETIYETSGQVVKFEAIPLTVSP